MLNGCYDCLMLPLKFIVFNFLLSHLLKDQWRFYLFTTKHYLSQRSQEAFTKNMIFSYLSLPTSLFSSQKKSCWKRMKIRRHYNSSQSLAGKFESNFTQAKNTTEFSDHTCVLSTFYVVLSSARDGKANFFAQKYFLNIF